VEKITKTSKERKKQERKVVYHGRGEER